MMVAQAHMHWLIQNQFGCQQQQPTGKNVTVAKKKQHAYPQYRDPEKMDLEQSCSGQNSAV